MKTEDSTQTPEYEERFIAFIDILGFKESTLVTKAEILVKMIGLLRSEAERKPYVIEKETHLFFMAGPGENNESDKFHLSREISVFSDLIVISYCVKNEVSNLNNLHKLLHSVYFIQEHLAVNSILIRGGITCGELYHKGDVCVGPALLRAYELESKIARYPRVILDPNLLSQQRFQGILGREPDYLEKYKDDHTFVTHFRPLKTFFDHYTGDDLERQLRFRRIYFIQTFAAYKIAIETALKSDHVGTIEKGNWLKEQYNETLRHFECYYDYLPEERKYIDIIDDTEIDRIDAVP